MITRFSTLYVGHIELERCGLAGTPADDRRYPNERLAETFDTAAALARAADTLGYETLWLAEHHFQHEGYECIPNIPMLAVDLAHRTERVKIGCAFNVVPAWHPLRLAEDYATADILTGGRVVFGVGRGYHTREVETLRQPDAGRRGQPRALRGAGGDHPEGVPRGVVLAPGEALHDSAGGPLPRLSAEGDHAGAASAAPARSRSGSPS